MKLTITHQETYSRGELLLRSFFGWLYILIPHYCLLIFVALWGAILGLISFFSIVFTGKYPKSFFDYQVAMNAWVLRVSARWLHLSDGYPAFGLKGTDTHTSFEMPYPESLSKGLALLKFFFGWLYCALPHIFLWYFRMIGTFVLIFLAWWAVLFTGKYPASWHKFNVGTLRWITRVNLYLGYMTDEYPPFSGKETETSIPGVL